MAPPLDPTRTARHLAALLTGYLLLVIAVITLAPFHMAWPARFAMHWIVLDGGWEADVLLNIVLFLPVGFVLRRGVPALRGRGALSVLAAGALISLGIETAQLFIAGRYSTASDIVANALGAWCGALLSDLVSARVGEGRVLVGRLRLDVPLMGVVYLLLPLLWLNGLIAPADTARALWPLLPLCLAGTVALGAVSEQGRAATTLTGVVWFAVGAVPVLRAAPAAALILLPVVALAAAGSHRWWQRVLQRDRRLEPQVVRALLPLVVIHFSTIGATPGVLTLAGGPEAARVEILRWVGRLAAFTILGYLVAEARGRRRERLAVLVLPPAIVAAAAEGVMALAWRDAGPMARHLFPVIAAVLGATLYHLQRAHILALLDVRTAITSDPVPVSR